MSKRLALTLTSHPSGHSTVLHTCPAQPGEILTHLPDQPTPCCASPSAREERRQLPREVLLPGAGLGKAKAW